MPIEIKCENCGKKTFKQPYQLRKSSHHFCSRKCMFEYRKKNKSVKKRNDFQFKKLMNFAEIRKEMLRNRNDND